MPRGRKKAIEPIEDAPVVQTVSAPATTARRTRRMSTPVFVGILGFFGIIVLVGTMFLGRSDRGQIDVSAAIQNANEIRVAKGEEAVQDTTTSETLRNLPNGGLVPQDGAVETSPQAAPEAQENASSTESLEGSGDTSSSTPENTETTVTENTEEAPQPDTSAEESTETTEAPPAEGTTP